jgi:hypothetical protein
LCLPESGQIKSGTFQAEVIAAQHRITILAQPDNFFALRASGWFISRRIFRSMEAAQRVAGVISEATVSRVRKHDVLIFVITNPQITAWRLRQRFSLSAQPALRLTRSDCRCATVSGFVCSLLLLPASGILLSPC